jgi:hypothetical protein
MGLIESAQTIIFHCLAMAEECPSCLQKKKHRGDCEIITWLAAYASRPEMVVRIITDQFGTYYTWQAQDFRCNDPYPSRAAALADARGVAESLGLRIKIEGAENA